MTDNESRKNDREIKCGTADEVDAVKESLVADVCDYFGRQYEEGDRSQPSMRTVAEKFSISPMKVKKILVTGGLFQTKKSDEIQHLYTMGYSVKQIATMEHMSVSNVNSNLPYKKIIYNLDVRNEEAVKALQWRNNRANRIIGRPTKNMQEAFDNTVKRFKAIYDQPLNIKLSVCNIDNGSSVLLHFIRRYRFDAKLPANMPLSDYIASVDGVSFMHGTSEDGEDVDGILLREDLPFSEKYVTKMLAQIYCKRYESRDGNFYRRFCGEGDELEQNIMQSGYSVWSGFITEMMAQRVLEIGNTSRNGDSTDEIKNVYDGIKEDEYKVAISKSEDAMACVLVDTISCNEKSTIFPKTQQIVADHGVDFRIDRNFIWELGLAFLIESQQTQITELHRRGNLCMSELQNRFAIDSGDIFL